MTASERIRAAREWEKEQTEKPGRKLVTFYAPAECYCLACKVKRFWTRP